MMETVLVIGGSGFIGSFLCEKLKEKGFQVSILSRREQKDSPYIPFVWNLDKQEIDIKAIESANYIINLAGENIGEKRWTSERKKLILDSRVKTTDFIFEKVREYNPKLKAYISASAIGYYGTITSDKIFIETDAPANDFLGEVCQEWEKEADNFSSIGIRTVKIRTSLVISSKGGALSKMLIPIQMGIGSPMGSGKQYMPWIHIEDLCQIYIKAIEDIQMQGAYNAASTEQVNNKKFTKTMAQVFHKPFWFISIPSILFKLFFGEMSDILLKGSRVSNERLIQSGFQFKYNSTKQALTEIFETA